MKCIFCLTEAPDKDFSIEHVFPEAIGGCYTIKSLCKPCNDKLGQTVDSELVNCFVIESERLLLSIKGKKGELPNPIQRGTLANDRDQDVRYELDKEGHPESISVRPHVSESEDEDGNKIISVSVDAAEENKLPEIVNKKLRRSGLQPLSEEEIEARKTRKEIAGPRVRVERSVSPLEGHRGVMKIAYELACETLGEQYLQDPTAELIRSYMLDNSPLESLSSKYEIPGSIGLVSSTLSVPLFRGNNKPHIALLQRDGQRISAYVRIFEAIEGKMLITAQADKYASFEDTVVCNDPVSKQCHKTGFGEAIKTWEGQ